MNDQNKNRHHRKQVNRLSRGGDGYGHDDKTLKIRVQRFQKVLCKKGAG